MKYTRIYNISLKYTYYGSIITDYHAKFEFKFKALRPWNYSSLGLVDLDI